ncbi:LuxR C-terminal-related transcriptional regulator [Streptomyces sp. NPDC058734]|uniref:LuxR C-terminal-related transcriptional regulator n=1 Tax=Streptomyces sp. NPDC058734 TaxID=3346615 RepID=UPI0036CE39E2
MVTVEERSIDRARAAAAREAWAEAYPLLRALDPARLGPDDQAVLADAAWWTGRVDESITARARAYTGYEAAGLARGAAMMAWLLYYEHRLAGRTSAAAGWLARSREQLRDLPECEEQCYLVWVETEEAQERGAFSEAAEKASEMAAIARRCGSTDLLAMSTLAQSGVLLAEGRVAEGLARLDGAMCAATAGELSAFFTGWIYCLGLQACMACADLRRAAEWAEAAMAWCASMPEANNFRGLCRVHRAQVAELSGDWARAADEAAVTCAELLPYETRMAAEAVYVTAGIQRRRGDLAAAEASYARAHELGRDPQPGLSLLHLAQGKAAAAAAGLRGALAREDAEEAGLPERTRLLAAQVEVALALGDMDVARAAAGELAAGALAWEERCGSAHTVLHARAAAARGAVAYAAHEEDARALLHRALALWLELGVPYEAAQVRMTLAAAARAGEDEEGARLELQAARAVFTQLGAEPDARRAAALLGSAERRLPGGLTERESQVLRLVAAGHTNRSIAAELVISEHTVARHLNNIFAKLDVSSRAAATAYVYTHGLA